MEISMNLARTDKIRYMAISLYLAMKHTARYISGNSHVPYGYSNKTYMEISVHVTDKQVFSHLMINCSNKSCEI